VLRFIPRLHREAERKTRHRADLAKRFTRAKPEDLAEILNTLVTLARARPGTFVR